MTGQVPTLDIRRFKSAGKQFVEQLGEAYAEFGFCGISGHGIPESVIQNCYDVIEAFFALPLAVKQRYHQPGLGGARGYTGFGIETARDSRYPDLKEFWHVGPETGPAPQHPSLYPNCWPVEVPDFRSATLALYQALRQLGEHVLQALALYLGEDQSYFADKICYGNSILRPIHYPPVSGIAGGSIRSGRHEDINLITLLVGASEPGLEILRPDGTWLPVTTDGDAIAVNIGDMLQRLSNNVLPSTTHRVINPDGDAAQRSRYSIPFFLHPNPDFLISTMPGCVNAKRPDRYPESISANKYLLQRLTEIGLLK